MWGRELLLWGREGLVWGRELLLWGREGLLWGRVSGPVSGLHISLHSVDLRLLLRLLHLDFDAALVLQRREKRRKSGRRRKREKEGVREAERGRVEVGRDERRGR